MSGGTRQKGRKTLKTQEKTNVMEVRGETGDDGSEAATEDVTPALHKYLSDMTKEIRELKNDITALNTKHSSRAVEVLSLYLALGPAETDVTGGTQDIRNEGGDAETHGDRRQQRPRDVQIKKRRDKEREM
ncbi:hypothetical protein PAMP_022837 [Pampus punctatissimus]